MVGGCPQPPPTLGDTLGSITSRCSRKEPALLLPSRGGTQTTRKSGGNRAFVYICPFHLDSEMSSLRSQWPEGFHPAFDITTLPSLLFKMYISPDSGKKSLTEFPMAFPDLWQPCEFHRPFPYSTPGRRNNYTRIRLGWTGSLIACICPPTSIK